MPEIKINRFFQETLGANLKNSRWSWGAIDPVFNRVFLRIWEDQIQPDGIGEKVQIYWKNPIVRSPGLAEREAHLKAIESGVRGIGIVCRARDPNTTEARQIADFQKDIFLQLGEFSEDDKGVYAHIDARIPIGELMRARTAHSTLTQDLRTIISTKMIDNTVKEALVNARVGQGIFRSSVLSLWNNRCSVTGSGILDAIRASHIKPWRDSTNLERLDPENGLPLIASLDALFDAGLISFEDSGRLLISSKVSRSEQVIYGISGKTLMKKPSSRTATYLHYHRSKLYQK